MKSVAQHANYKAFLDRLYREGDPVKRTIPAVSPQARRRATAGGIATRKAALDAQRVWALVMGRLGIQ